MGVTILEGGSEETHTQLNREARAAFTASIEYFHDAIDREIADHTESGVHPDRPTTPRREIATESEPEEVRKRAHWRNHLPSAKLWRVKAALPSKSALDVAPIRPSRSH